MELSVIATVELKTNAVSLGGGSAIGLKVEVALLLLTFPLLWTGTALVEREDVIAIELPTAVPATPSASELICAGTVLGVLLETAFRDAPAAFASVIG